MSDLTKRLRERHSSLVTQSFLMFEAADEIDRLTRELAKAPAKIDFITDGGPWVDHNMPCPINWVEESAVFDMNRNVFLPSWKAQEDGWMTVKATGWRGKLTSWLTR